MNQQNEVNLTDAEKRLMVARGGGWAKWEEPRGTNSSHKINKSWGGNVQRGDYDQPYRIAYYVTLYGDGTN